MMDILIFIDAIGYSYLFPAISCLSLGVFSYNYFFQNDNFQYLNYYEWVVPAGYTVAQFMGLLIGTILFPLGIMSMLIFALQSFKNTDKYYHITGFVYALLSAIFFTSSGLVYNYMDAKGNISPYDIIRIVMVICIVIDIINCAIFCFTAQSTTYTTNNAGIVAIGVIYFIFCILFGLLFLLLTLLVVFSPVNPSNTRDQISKQINRTSPHEEAAPLLPTIYPRNADVLNQISNPMHVTSNDYLSHLRNIPPVKQSPKKWVSISLGFLVLYPLMFFACISLPTWWNRFNRYYIQKYQVCNHRILNTFRRFHLIIEI